MSTIAAGNPPLLRKGSVMSYLQEFFRSIDLLPFKKARAAEPRELQLRHELVRFGKMLHTQGFVSACDGNLSVRLDEQRVMVTPTGMSKCMMEPEGMVIVDTSGKKLNGACNPTSEIAMHLTIYKTRPDVGAIVHAHPCSATAFASAGMALDEPLCSEIVITLGSVPLAPYATPGTNELSESLQPFIPSYDAILMANHGVVTYAADLLHAYMKMEAVEHYAKIVLATRQLGCRKILAENDLGKLLHAREKYMKNSN